MIRTTRELREELNRDLEHLVAGCAGGEPEASRRLLESVRTLTMSLGTGVYRLGLDDAEDLAQIVQLRVLDRMGQLRQPAAFPAWVRRLIHHAALDMLRGRRWTLSLDAPDGPEIAAPLRATPDPYDQIDARTDLDRALARLPEHYREPIRLYLLEGVPQDRVGQRLGRPRSTVATQIERGLKRLRPMLASSAA
jgi:RNA polymerase sigma factor (sigma-70 family)